MCQSAKPIIASFCQNISKQASVQIVSFSPVLIQRKDRCLDNLALDANGAIWAAGQSIRSWKGSLFDKSLGFPNVFTLIHRHSVDPSVLAPSSALCITINTGPQAFYGEKFKIDKVFEDDGSLASGTTSAAYDSERHRLFLHGNSQSQTLLSMLITNSLQGLASPHLTVCNISYSGT